MNVSMVNHIKVFFACWHDGLSLRINFCKLSTDTLFVVMTCNSDIMLNNLRLANANVIGIRVVGKSPLREVNVILAHMVLSRYTTTCI